MKDKVAIVTGAGVGIGFEIVRQLLAGGARVLLNDSDAGLTQKAVESLGAGASAGAVPVRQAGASAGAVPVGQAGASAGAVPVGQTGADVRCIGLTGDAGDIGFIREMVDTAVRVFGRLDIVVANAGLTLFGDFFDYAPESFMRVMQLNLGGSFFLAQAAAKRMRDQGEGGSIIFTSSVTGHQAHRHLTAYGMSKAGVEMLARSLVVELSPYRITVNAVAPGATLTERTAEDPEYQKTWSALTPLGRPASVGDIAQAVLFLVGSGARQITGHTLIIDGGWSVVSPGPSAV